MGYARFWVSEHHSHPTILGTAPEILIAAIAGKTDKIRIGSAGVMLPHYSPLKVAEQFRVLDALAPGRIDLGLGRAPGSDGRTAFALNPMARERAEHFPSDVRDLMAWVYGEDLIENHPFGMVQAYPQADTEPELWILGSSDFGAQLAAHFGLPYCFAWFFTDGRGGKQAIDLYYENYKPSERFPEPRAALCVWCLAADTDAEAQHQYTSRAVWQLARDQGVFLPMEAPDNAANKRLNSMEEARLEVLREEALVGRATDVANKVRILADQVGVAEMAINTWAYDEDVRRKSYRLLSHAFDLTDRPAANA